MHSLAARLSLPGFEFCGFSRASGERLAPDTSSMKRDGHRGTVAARGQRINARVKAWTFRSITCLLPVLRN